MKIGKMMMVAGVGVLGAMSTARAQAPDTSPPATAPPTQLPPTIPDANEPVSPSAPYQPGVIPPLATPQALPPPAAAPYANTPPPPPPYEIEGATHPYPAWMTKIGVAMMLGGGYEDFTYSAVRAVTNGGGSWDARLAAGTRQFIALEAAYVGGARTVNLLGATSNTNLVNNGLEGDFRLNVPLAAGLSLVEPFAFVGLGWQHYSTTSSFTSADITSSSNVMTMPFGGGLMYAYSMFMVDARFTWRQTYFNNMFSTENAKLNTWGVGGNIGVEF